MLMIMEYIIQKFWKNKFLRRVMQKTWKIHKRFKVMEKLKNHLKLWSAKTKTKFQEKFVSKRNHVSSFHAVLVYLKNFICLSPAVKFLKFWGRFILWYPFSVSVIRDLLIMD